jgi:hypothetical protein
MNTKMWLARSVGHDLSGQPAPESREVDRGRMALRRQEQPVSAADAVVRAARHGRGRPVLAVSLRARTWSRRCTGAGLRAAGRRGQGAGRRVSGTAQASNPPRTRIARPRRMRLFSEVADHVRDSVFQSESDHPEPDSRPSQGRQPRQGLRRELSGVRTQLRRAGGTQTSGWRCGAAGQPVHGRGFHEAVRVAADLAPSGFDGARAACSKQGLLHHRFIGSRRQCDGRAPDPPYRSGLPALPQRRLHGRALPQAAGHGPDHGFGVELCGQHGRPGLGRSPQGLGIEAVVGVAADVDDCFTLAEGARHRGRDRNREAHRPCPADSGRLDRDLLVRRRIQQPCDRPVRVQHSAVERLPEPARAGAVRLRGQRHRHLDQNPRRLGRGRIPPSRRSGLLLRRTASTSPKATNRSPPRSCIAAARAVRPSCICAPRASWVTPAPTSRSNTVRSRNCCASKPPIRCCAPRRSRSHRACSARTSCWRCTNPSAASAWPRRNTPTRRRSSSRNKK